MVAIDGPSASGKGTLGFRIAKALQFAFLDTGLLYRAVGLSVLKAGGNPDNPDQAIAAALDLHPERTEVLENPDLKGDAAGQAASKVGAIPQVRTVLLDFQRQFARFPPGGAPGAVLDGRDIGTVICPDAEAKLYVTADVEIRAERRLKELRQRGIPAIYDLVLEDMRNRDLRDSQRAVAPLRAAPDAYVLDTSRMDPDQTFEEALAYVVSRLGPRFRPGKAV
ncbi:MAG: (d)CMP kinase [Pseudomonadota bacterium]|nr:(d)CMP kinase [Pseudomonadota bacterium]